MQTDKRADAQRGGADGAISSAAGVSPDAMSAPGAARGPDGGPASPGRPDDAAVVRASLTDPERFAELFHRHAGPIGRYIARRIGAQDAEDVLADTFLEAFRLRRQYDAGRADARPWLYGIATRRLGRYRRTELKQLRVLERTGTDPVLSFTERSDAQLAADAAVRRLSGALRRLPKVHREALLLCAWAELTYDEVATALGVPVGTVRSRISRARRALRDALGGVDPTSLSEEE